MALAFLLIAVLVTIIWLSRPQISHQVISLPQRRRLKIVSLLFFVCLFGEGLLGSQLREQTDELAIAAETEQGIEREKWGAELGATIIYKIHRSFSWSLLVTAGLLFFWMKREKDWRAAEPKLIFSMVIAMMLMGVVLGHIAIYPVVQVLHVGMTSVLLAVTWHWIMRLWSTKSVAVTV